MQQALCVVSLFSIWLSLMQIFRGVPAITGKRALRLGRGLYHLINVFTLPWCRVLLQEFPGFYQKQLHQEVI